MKQLGMEKLRLRIEGGGATKILIKCPLRK